MSTEIKFEKREKHLENIKNGCVYFTMWNTNRMGAANLSEYLRAIKLWSADKPQLDRKVIFIVDDVADLVFAYAPGLDREAIEDEADDDQLLDAFWALLQRAFPANFIKRLMAQSGGLASGITKNSPSVNGDGMQDRSLTSH